MLDLDRTMFFKAKFEVQAVRGSMRCGPSF